MPRAARRKREKQKELVETAERMRKLTSFFSSAPAENVVDQNIDSRSNLTLLSATETPSTCLSPHSLPNQNLAILTLHRLQRY